MLSTNIDSAAMNAAQMLGSKNHSSSSEPPTGKTLLPPINTRFESDFNGPPVAHSKITPNPTSATFAAASASASAVHDNDTSAATTAVAAATPGNMGGKDNQQFENLADGT